MSQITAGKSRRVASASQPAVPISFIGRLSCFSRRSGPLAGRPFISQDIRDMISMFLNRCRMVGKRSLASPSPPRPRHPEISTRVRSLFLSIKEWSSILGLVLHANQMIPKLTHMSPSDSASMPTLAVNRALWLTFRLFKRVFFPIHSTSGFMMVMVEHTIPS